MLSGRYPGTAPVKLHFVPDQPSEEVIDRNGKEIITVLHAIVNISYKVGTGAQMASPEIDVSTPVHAYQEIRRKLLSLRKRKPTVDDNDTWRSLKRKREFAPPEVIKRLSNHDRIRKDGAGVMASVHVTESGKNMAVIFVSTPQSYGNLHLS